MLCVAKLRPGGHAYYLEVVATGVEEPGKWLSAGCGEVGLSGEVDGRDMGAVLSGVDPSSGERLGRFHHRVTVAGFDLTFAAPKSVSLLHALGGPEVATEVRSAHDSAVADVISYVERRALAVRRRTDVGPPAVLPVEGVAAGGFVHRTSRALDPHLHTHVVVANLGRGPDGTWSALDGRGVYAHTATAGSLYHARLRHELTQRLGVGWGPLRDGRADVAGIGPEVRREFSRRSAEIEAHLVDRGLLGRTSGRASSRAKSVAGYATRADRDPNLSPETLRGPWERRALAVGLTPRSLEAVLDRVPRDLDARPGHPKEMRPRDTGGRVPDGAARALAATLSDLGRSVTRRDALRSLCSVLERGAPVREVERLADGYLATLRPEVGWRGARDAPGVGERRHAPEERAFDRLGREEQGRVDELLERRGMSRKGIERDGLVRGVETGMSKSRDDGLGIGL